MNSIAALDSILDKLGIAPGECVFVGDDVPDLPLLEHVGYSVAVGNAVDAVRERCNYTTSATGGFGAVREVADLVLAARHGATG